jgi:hypothetical protein
VLFFWKRAKPSSKKTTHTRPHLPLFGSEAAYCATWVKYYFAS